MNPAPSTAQSIVIIDERDVTRVGVSELIRREPDLELSAAESTIEAAVSQLSGKKPALIVATLHAGGAGLAEMIRDVIEAMPGSRILIASSQDERLFAERALRSGAHGFVGIDVPATTLLTAVRRVLAGEYYLSPAITQMIVSRAGSVSEPACEPMDVLTDREMLVFQLLGSGKSVKEIGLKLSLSGKTI